MVLVDLVVLDTQPRRDPGTTLLRTDEVFTPCEEVQLLKLKGLKRGSSIYVSLACLLVASAIYPMLLVWGGVTHRLIYSPHL